MQLQLLQVYLKILFCKIAWMLSPKLENPYGSISGFLIQVACSLYVSSFRKNAILLQKSILNFVTFWQKSWKMSSKCQEVTLEKILQIQDLKITCIFQVIAINGGIIVLTTFKVMKTMLDFSPKFKKDNMFYLFKLKWMEISVYALTLMLEWRNHININHQSKKLNKYLIQHFSQSQLSLRLKLHLIKIHLISLSH